MGEPTGSFDLHAGGWFAVGARPYAAGAAENVWEP
jgi:hypothetical protein